MNSEQYEVHYHDQRSGGQIRTFASLKEAEALVQDIWMRPEKYNCNLFSREDRPYIYKQLPSKLNTMVSTD